MRLVADSTDAAMLRGAARYAMRHNKGMNLTSVERIGRSQLIPSVGPTLKWSMRLTVIATLLCTVAQAQAPSAATPDQDLARFTQLESQWNDAHLQGDAEALDRLWADDFRVVVPRMTPLSKAEALSFFRSGRMKFSRYETSELGVRVYADTAVVTGRVRRSRERAGQMVEDDWRFTKVYVRAAGAWRVVAYHASETGP